MLTTNNNRQVDSCLNCATSIYSFCSVVDFGFGNKMRRYCCNLTSFILVLITSLLLKQITTVVVVVMAFHPFTSFVHKQTVTNAFTRPNHYHQHVYKLSTLALSSSESGSRVESLSLDILGDNHEQVGDEIATSVQAMLDTEWMPQNIHYKMGQSVKQSYIKVRRSATTNESTGNSGNDDMIMTIMTTVADDLIMNWKEYDKDAFVNAWDIANYVSDYLTTKINGDACGCSAKIY